MSDDRLIDTAVQAAAGGGGFAGVLLFARWLLNWLAGRMDRRQAMLDTQDAKIDAEWRELRDELKADNAAMKAENAEMRKRVDEMDRRGKAMRWAFQHVAGALILVDPKNPALARAENILAEAFPGDFGPLVERAAAAIDRVTESKP